MVCSMLEPGRAPSTTGTTTIIITAVLAYSHPQLSTLVTRPKSWLRANAHWISLMPLIKIALFMDLPVRNLCLRQFGSIRPATSRRPSHQIASMFPNLFTEFVSKPLTHSAMPLHSLDSVPHDVRPPCQDVLPCPASFPHARFGRRLPAPSFCARSAFALSFRVHHSMAACGCCDCLCSAVFPDYPPV